jgi:hypothetical protein
MLARCRGRKRLLINAEQHEQAIESAGKMIKDVVDRFFLTESHWGYLRDSEIFSHDKYHEKNRDIR